MGSLLPPPPSSKSNNGDVGKRERVRIGEIGGWECEKDCILVWDLRENLKWK